MNKHAEQRLKEILERGWYYAHEVIPASWTELWEAGIIQWPTYHIYNGSSYVSDSIRAKDDELAVQAAKELYDIVRQVTHIVSKELEVYSGAETFSQSLGSFSKTR